ncbi:Myb-like_DNA-binding domain-containing protein [Hexamita inflata]|uniref:Myb-like DNA-binding domain-containing protein n=1 Tax=Hexamita inflata TaxID=28002 RepID=A0AA86RBK9_9EUKA|nr:Myb-like DNA-binding domain-containing protein [Hexamita inflata]
MSYREWTKDEINKLITAAEQFKRGRGIDWKQVANYVNTRSERQCQNRYFPRTKNGLSPRQIVHIAFGLQMKKIFQKSCILTWSQMEFICGLFPWQRRKQNQSKILQFQQISRQFNKWRKQL